MMQQCREIRSAILPLTIDGIFKLYFENPQNLPELRRFLKANLDLDDEDLAQIEVLNPGLLKAHADDKGFTVDLLLKTNTNHDIHIEMQTKSHPRFKERIQIYNARKAGSQIKVGEDYSHVKRTISLIITNFQMFKASDNYQEKVMMRRENGEIFTGLQEINIIDLTKLTTGGIAKREAYLWGKLFKAKTREDLKMLANESEEMAQATEKLLQISEDERAQAYALSRDNAEFIRVMREKERVMREKDLAEKATARGLALGIEQGITQGIEQGITQGIEQGITQGIEQGIAQGHSQVLEDVVRAGLNNHIPIETISIMTGFSVQEIEILLAKTGK